VNEKPEKNEEKKRQLSKMSANRLTPRVTRLGEYSPIGRLLPLGSFLITEVTQNFVLLRYFHSSGFALILRKQMAGLHFGRLFHKTHLVTLLLHRLFLLSDHFFAQITLRKVLNKLGLSRAAEDPFNSI
jgi:hypothetical protein